MEILVYEHITSGVLCESPLPASLMKEGDLMLQAILKDLLEVREIKITILRDFRLPIPSYIHYYHTIYTLSQFHQTWQYCLDKVDGVLPIAPESGNTLTKIQEQIIKSGKILLGCHPQATQIASSKIETEKYLRTAGLNTPYTIRLSDWQLDRVSKEESLICKPDDGAGCLYTFYFKTPLNLHLWKQKNTLDTKNYIVQPYIQGQAISLSLLYDGKKARLLSVNQQQMKIKKNRIYLNAILVNAIMAENPIYHHLQEIANTIANTLPGLWGFIGVDLIIVQNQSPIILEINPRPTTSYVGLRIIYGISPMQWLITLLYEGLDKVVLPSNLGFQLLISLKKKDSKIIYDGYS
ncbi:ATP-grasp domain-containing protein [Candidatus Nitrosacidococcus tergens]|uniref:ATP-grasp domain-containing protein n=1 Tax=Candidatus Nitrosacidococcus tergens TaxID=553981 RepID=A0A7G1Q7B3_9GAMM|nr:ATP-grasp domain-containing protein [Candidatus Nitrosacidococcus tergens]CAB1274259.1 conserved protein of unknown function [Candidatus Nitrosacidococcus tergens]